MIIPKMFVNGNMDNHIFLEGVDTQEYFTIITNATTQCRTKGGDVYYESHHIIPKSMGGNNTKHNLALLTAQEHFRCHQLLVDMVTGPHQHKMYRAWFRMVHGNRHQRTVPVDAEEYEKIRRQISQHMSQKFKGITIPDERKQRISNSKQGTMTDSHRQAISDAHKGKTPWNKGHRGMISEETRQKIRESKLGKTRPSPSEETRQKMAESHRGKVPWNAGITGYSRKSPSEETKQKIRESRLRTEALKRARVGEIVDVAPDVPHE